MSAQLTDRELLEFAAKAAGIELIDWHDSWADVGPGYRRLQDGLREVWNPLTNDGDALRLMLNFSFGISFDCYQMQSNDLFGRAFRVRIWCARGWVKEEFDSEEAKAAAVRLCIVRAAAEIGKAMP